MHRRSRRGRLSTNYMLEETPHRGVVWCCLKRVDFVARPDDCSRDERMFYPGEEASPDSEGRALECRTADTSYVLSL